MIDAVAGAESGTDAVACGEPVVLLGRGGSGTRLLSQLGLANGIFLGTELNVSGDSLEWVDTIYRLAIDVTTAGADVDPQHDDGPRDALRSCAAGILAAARRSADATWGWKLPETILVVPQVLRAFPRARLVHLVRHPVNSALRRTHMTSRMDNPIGRAVLPAAYRACGMDPADIARDAEYVHNAVSWEFQLRGLSRAMRASNAVRLLQLRYEDVCADPDDAQRRIAHFLGGDAPARSCSSIIDRDRMDAVIAADERVDHVWSICGATAAEFGYARPL